eukprot:CAMPEP_0167813534 /NCGR_PEP_ID=MMETSP0112_2-20121227/1910_1 /TAXON_ID=91324 /ORGANISM="Lotharella globosa, Strain CCCM811" /LENGTH=199 /DNA_ID=CAMNT_0007712633 /DNA_START=67 /DNA_END=666 /DNA_ORIENTATION=+
MQRSQQMGNVFFCIYVDHVLRNFTVGHVGIGRPSSMHCGAAPLCGVLVLESGYGSGSYHHGEPAVHGLWPETGRYGTSQCIQPKERADPSSTSPCYDDLSFMRHEWEKHGVCAGVQDSSDYFSQICSLSKAPLAVMQSLKGKGATLEEMADALEEDQGYPVYYVDSSSDSQIYLSACSAGYGRPWQLADVAEFSMKCHP